MECWSSYANTKLDWAVRANTKLVSLIQHNELRGLVEGHEASDTKVALVYGKTQVGKSTLILTLMGIKEEFFEEVQDVLRAGRPNGRSSTSTAIRYTYSTDSSWRLNGLVCNGSEVKRGLFDIRKELEKHAVYQDDVIDIGIPSEYFQEASNLEIIDLPGIESCDGYEHGHVEVLTRKYLAKSHLTMIVTPANDIQDIKNFRLNNQFDWFVLPGFCVVTTKTYKADTIRSKIGNQIIDRDSLECLYSQDSKEALKGIKTYLLDYGDSFAELKKHHPEKYQVIKPVRDQILNELKESILTSSNELERLRRNFRLSEIVKKIILDKNLLLESVRSEYGQKKEELTQKLKEKMSLLGNIEKKNKFQEKIDHIKFIHMAFCGEASNEKFKKYFMNEKERLLKEFEDQQQKHLLDESVFSSYWEECVGSAENDVDRWFEYVSRKLRDLDDEEKASNAVKNFSDRLTRLCNQEINKRNRDIEKNNTKHKKANEYHFADVKRKIASLEQDIKHLSDQYELKIRDIELELSALMSDELLKFGDILDEEFEAEMKETKLKIEKQDSPAEILLLMAYAKLISDVYQDIKNTEMKS